MGCCGEDGMSKRIMSDPYCEACRRGDYDACTARSDNPCPMCGRVNRHACPSWESGLHNYCYGCAGYPFCSCKTSHTGDCASNVTPK